MHVCRRTIVSTLVANLLAGTLLVSTAAAQNDDSAKKYQQVVDRAIAFLATKGQKDDGSFTANSGPAVTALIATAVLRQGARRKIRSSRRRSNSSRSS